MSDWLTRLLNLLAVILLLFVGLLLLHLPIVRVLYSGVKP